MTTTVSAADELVARLLAARDDQERRAFALHSRLTPTEARETVLRLVDEIPRLRAADLAQAEFVCSAALALADRAADRYTHALVRMRQGDLLYQRGYSEATCAVLDEAAAEFTGLGALVEAARTRINWVRAAARLGRLSEAFDAARRARSVLRAQGQTGRLFALEVNTGTIYYEHGMHRQALRRFSAALALAHAHDDILPSDVAACRLNRGLALIALGRHRQAITELERARLLRRSLGQPQGEARAMANIGLAQMEMGRCSVALRAFQHAAAVYAAAGLNRDAVWVAYHIADCYLSLGSPADALQALDAAAPALDRSDHLPDRLAVTTRRIAALLALGRDQEALEPLYGAERDLPVGGIQHRAWLEVCRAEALRRAGSATEACVSARRATFLAGQSGLRALAADAAVLEGEALLGSAGPEQAATVAARAHRLARATGAPRSLQRSWQLLGRLAEATGRPDLARRRYARAIEQHELERGGVIFDLRDSFAGERQTAYERLAALQFQRGDARAALLTAERAKSRALADAVAGRLELHPRGTAQARRLARELIAAREDYAAARSASVQDDPMRSTEPVVGDALRRLEERIVDLSRRLQLTGSHDPYGPDPQVRLPALSHGTLLLEFFASGPDLLRFELDQRGVRGTLIAGGVAEATRLVRAFRLNLATAARTPAERQAGLAAQARALLDRLGALCLPALATLGSYRTLIVVPHAVLHYVPFHALVQGGGYLIERYAVAYAPSAALYSICRARHAETDGEALVLGFSAGGRLPAAVQEAQEIAAALGARAHVHEEATRTLLSRRTGDASLIHLAAHGEFRPDAPLFSSIELADGPLTVADVFNLDVHSALVTLSACETGLSRLGSGDDLAGLTRAFLYAGASALLLSQWRVEDGSTERLMGAFYGARKRGAGHAEALRAAQSALLECSVSESGPPHPFYWAGFQLIGNDQG